MQISRSMDSHCLVSRSWGLLDLPRTATAKSNLAVEICVRYLSILCRVIFPRYRYRILHEPYGLVTFAWISNWLWWWTRDNVDFGQLRASETAQDLVHANIM